MNSEFVSWDQALRLFDEGATPLHELGIRADARRKELCGDEVFYNVNSHINPTNVCQYRCALCAYSCDADSPKAYRMSLEEMLATARTAAEAGCREVHIVSGVDPVLPYSWYLEIVREIHRAFPRLLIKAFTAVEIAWMAEISHQTPSHVLEQLKEVGLSTLPGGGAEILVDSVRQKICAKKPMSDVWLDVHRAAHRLGIPSTASILYGHIETFEDRVTHLFKLRDLQAETGGFLALIPLAFHPAGAQLPLGNKKLTSAADDLRMIAAARLILHNFRNIKAYWISLGVSTAQIALAYGANDLDGTVRQEKIHHDAGSLSPQCLTIEELEHLIREAGRVPVRRDSLYRAV
ncbi:MAG: CofH family radical SAM protein [Planctomycetia bacterium]|nr:CofH family radical SAM protein [Planctomycetia bacterium]